MFKIVFRIFKIVFKKFLTFFETQENCKNFADSEIFFEKVSLKQVCNFKVGDFVLSGLGFLVIAARQKVGPQKKPSTARTDIPPKKRKRPARPNRPESAVG